MLKAKQNKQIHRQVVDVTGYEPNICYVGNAMVRRSRRELAKLRIAAGETDAAIIPSSPHIMHIGQHARSRPSLVGKNIS